MDRTPHDPTAGVPSDPNQDAAYAGAGLGQPPGDGDAGEAPAGAPTAEWTAQLERERARADAAERQAQAHAQQVAQFQNLIQAAQAQQEQQQYADLDRRFAAGEIDQAQYRQGMAYFISRERERAQQAAQQVQQVQHGMSVRDYKAEVVRQLGLTPAEARKLDKLDRIAPHDPDVYAAAAMEIVEDRQEREADRQRLSALEADREADAYVASGATRLGGAAPLGGGKPGEIVPGSDEHYLSLPGFRRR